MMDALSPSSPAEGEERSAQRVGSWEQSWVLRAHLFTRCAGSAQPLRTFGWG